MTGFCRKRFRGRRDAESLTDLTELLQALVDLKACATILYG